MTDRITSPQDKASVIAADQVLYGSVNINVGGTTPAIECTAADSAEAINKNRVAIWGDVDFFGTYYPGSHPPAQISMQLDNPIKIGATSRNIGTYIPVGNQFDSLIRFIEHDSQYNYYLVNDVDAGGRITLLDLSRDNLNLKDAGLNYTACTIQWWNRYGEIETGAIGWVSENGSYGFLLDCNGNIITNQDTFPGSYTYIRTPKPQE